MTEMFEVAGILIFFIILAVIVILIGSYIIVRLILPWFSWLADMYVIWNEEFKEKHEGKGDKK